MNAKLHPIFNRETSTNAERWFFLYQRIVSDIGLKLTIGRNPRNWRTIGQQLKRFS